MEREKEKDCVAAGEERGGEQRETRNEGRKKKIENARGGRKGVRRVGCCERSKRTELCADESGRTAYHHYRSLPPSMFLRFSVSVTGPASQRSLSPSGHRAVPLSLSLSHTHIYTLTLSLSLSLSPCPWRFSRESGRGAASRAREMPVIRRDFNYAHYESFSPRETRGTVLDARSSALRDKGGPASRRSAPRVRSDALFYEHDRPLPLLLYSRHAVTLACTTSAATIAVPLFSHLFSLIVPYFFVVIGIIGGRSFYITYHRYYQLSPRDRFYFFLLSLRLAINETFRRAKLGNFRRVHFEDTMIRVRERWYRVAINAPSMSIRFLRRSFFSVSLGNRRTEASEAISLE